MNEREKCIWCYNMTYNTVDWYHWDLWWEEKKRWNSLWCIYILFNTKCFERKEIENKYLREIVQKEVKRKRKKGSMLHITFQFNWHVLVFLGLNGEKHYVSLCKYIIKITLQFEAMTNQQQRNQNNILGSLTLTKQGSFVRMWGRIWLAMFNGHPWSCHETLHFNLLHCSLSINNHPRHKLQILFYSKPFIFIHL